MKHDENLIENGILKKIKISKKIILWTSVTLVLLIFAGAVGFVVWDSYFRQPPITNTLVSERLEPMSEMTTAKLIYSGCLVKNDDKSFFTKDQYAFTYSAEVKASLDLSKVHVDDSDPAKVIITIPNKVNTSVKVDTDSMELLFENRGIFKKESIQDGVNAVNTAENDVKAKANLSALEELARKQAKTLIENLFIDLAGKRQIIVKFK